MENWSRSYRVVVGVPIYEKDKFFLDAKRIIQKGLSVFTQDDNTTEPLGSRVLSNLASEGKSKRGFTFTLDSIRGVAKTSNSQSEKTTIKLYNLDQDIINVMNTKGCVVRVYAGYNEDVKLAYSGEISQVLPVPSGADTVYNLKCVDGLGSLQNTVGTLSYDEDMSVKDVIIDLANRFPDAALGPAGLANLASTFVTGGFTFTGSLATAFGAIIKRNNLSYGRFNGKMVILPNQIKEGDANSKEFSGTNFTLTSDLIKGLQASSLNGNKTVESSKELSGVTVNTFFTPIELGQYFTIPPEVDKTYAGTFQATKIRTKLQSQGNAWDVVITGTKVQ